MSQHHLLESEIHIASFDDHYLYDSLSLHIDTVEQNVPRLAQDCFEIITQMIEGNEPAMPQRVLPATLRWRHAQYWRPGIQIPGPVTEQKPRWGFCLMSGKLTKESGMCLKINDADTTVFPLRTHSHSDFPPLTGFRYQTDFCATN
jgi:hypothetical protein